MATRTIVAAICILGFVGVAYANSTYMIFDDWGGSWTDADKTIANTQDDNQCWAASTSNILEWTGWGSANENTTSSDEIFAYYQDHWTNQGGSPYYAMEWWFDGTNNSQGSYYASSGWAQTTAEGGGFYPEEDFRDYFQFTSDTSNALASVDQYLHDGSGTSLSLYSSSFAHSVTVWGVDYNDDNEYAGIWITDSDDDQIIHNGNELRYYDVRLEQSAWFLQDYFGYNDVYIGNVLGLGLMPGWTGTLDDPVGGFPVAVPAPSAVLLGSIGIGFIGWMRKKRSAI